MNVKRNALVLFAAGGLALFASAATLTSTNTWQGAAAATGTEWKDKANWSLGEAPIDANRPFGTLRFTDSTTITVTGWMYFNHILVEKGDLLINDSDGKATYLVFEGDGASRTDSRLEVAEGASLTFDGKPHPTAGSYTRLCPGTPTISQRGNLAKLGKGTCSIKMMFSPDAAYFFYDVHVYEGRLEILTRQNQLNTSSGMVHVHHGGTMALGSQVLAPSIVASIDEGGVLSPAGNTLVEETISGVTGGGVVSNLYLYCKLDGGPHCFSGSTARDVWFAPSQSETITDEEFGFIVGATNALAATRCKFQPLKIRHEPDVAAHSCLRFAPGVGLFRLNEVNLVSYTADGGEYKSHPFNLADTDGNAVTACVNEVTAPVCTGPATDEGGRGCLLFGRSLTWHGRMGERTDIGAESGVTVILGEDAVIDPHTVLRFAPGSVLDLGGRTVVVSRMTDGGKWRNGKLIQTDGPGMVLVVR